MNTKAKFQEIKKEIITLFVEEVWCCGLKNCDANPVISFPIKKRINTELFIDRGVELWLQKGS